MMASPLRPTMVYPDIERMIITYLDGKLPIPVRADVPDPRLAQFLTVVRVGGVEAPSRIADAPFLTMESWASSRTAAKATLNEARAWVKALTGTVLDGHSIYRYREVGGPAEQPDPESRQIRYVATVELQVRGTPLA